MAAIADRLSFHLYFKPDDWKTLLYEVQLAVFQDAIADEEEFNGFLVFSYAGEEFGIFSSILEMLNKVGVKYIASVRTEKAVPR